jgi:hypothetical protein
VAVMCVDPRRRHMQGHRERVRRHVERSEIFLVEIFPGCEVCRAAAGSVTTRSQPAGSKRCKSCVTNGSSALGLSSQCG